MFTLEKVLEVTQGRIIHGDLKQVTVTGISTDTRTLKSGELFLALEGKQYDGHAFVSQALKRGGSGAVISLLKHRIPETHEEEEMRRGKVIIGVNDTLSALQGLARFHRNEVRIPVLAITGSNGKTTTKEMAAAILSDLFRVLKSEGNINNEIRVPLTLLRLTAQHELAILEMGISGAGELRRLVQITEPQVGLITNIGPAHLETLSDIHGVADAKGELLEGLSADKGIAILNRDDAFFDFLKQKTSCSVVTFGLHPEAQVRAVDLSVSGLSATSFRLIVQPDVMERSSRFGRRPGTTTDIMIRLPLLGTHNVMNALAAAAAASVLGCPLEKMKQALETFKSILMRSQVFQWQGIVMINDAYNANPASMRAALEVLEHFETDGQRVAVLGDMLELGAADQGAHQDIGRHMTRISGGKLIAVGPRARRIAETALASGMSPDRVSVCEGTEEATGILKRTVRPGDVVLVKGSRGMRLEQIIEDLQKFGVGC